MKNHLLVFFLVLLSALQFSAFADGDPAKGKSIYATCIACHGQNGEGLQATNSPRLAGLHDWYLIRQLQYFKAGIRGDPKDKFAMEMRVKAKIGISGEKDIKDLAAYLSSIE